MRARWLRPLLVLSLALAVVAVRAQDDRRVKVTVEKANVRADASEKSRVLTQAKKGATFEMRGTEGDWFRVIVYLGPMRAIGYLSKKVAAIDTPGPDEELSVLASRRHDRRHDELPNPHVTVIALDHERSR